MADGFSLCRQLGVFRNFSSFSLASPCDALEKLLALFSSKEQQPEIVCPSLLLISLDTLPGAGCLLTTWTLCYLGTAIKYDDSILAYGQRLVGIDSGQRAHLAVGGWLKSVSYAGWHSR